MIDAVARCDSSRHSQPLAVRWRQFEICLIENRPHCRSRRKDDSGERFCYGSTQVYLHLYEAKRRHQLSYVSAAYRTPGRPVYTAYGMKPRVDAGTAELGMSSEYESCRAVTEGSDNMTQLYDEIGIGYRNYRRPDPSVATAIHRALGEAQTVVNIGAGAGSYEPKDRSVIAVEPSRAMIHQRQPDSAAVVQACATDLPFREAAFDAGLAILTVHHWPDPIQGLMEMVRVTQNRIVIVTWDPEAFNFWLIEDYFPAIAEIDRHICPSIEVFSETLGAIAVHPLPVPHDCLDGFLGAYWQRPHAYLDAGVRSAISAFSKLVDVDSGLARLRGDLESGTWESRYGHLLHESAYDLGYRLIIANPDLSIR